jgi:hypothetical protein
LSTVGPKKILKFCPQSVCYRSEDGYVISRGFPYGLKVGEQWALRNERGEVVAWSVRCEDLAEKYGLELLL